MQTPTDTQLHELARKRVDFRVHLVVYFVTNVALWIIWFVTGSGYVWPVWPMAIWGTGVLFHYLFEYRSSRFLSEEKEYEKLKGKWKNTSVSFNNNQLLVYGGQCISLPTGECGG